MARKEIFNFSLNVNLIHQKFSSCDLFIWSNQFESYQDQNLIIFRYQKTLFWSSVSSSGSYWRELQVMFLPLELPREEITASWGQWVNPDPDLKTFSLFSSTSCLALALGVMQTSPVHLARPFSLGSSRTEGPTLLPWITRESHSIRSPADASTTIAPGWYFFLETDTKSPYVFLWGFSCLICCWTSSTWDLGTSWRPPISLVTSRNGIIPWTQWRPLFLNGFWSTWRFNPLAGEASNDKHNIYAEQK